MKTVQQAPRRLVLGTVRGDTKGSNGPNMETVGLWTKPGLHG
jgi:hypothetical protein